MSTCRLKRPPLVVVERDCIGFVEQKKVSGRWLDTYTSKGWRVVQFIEPSCDCKACGRRAFLAKEAAAQAAFAAKIIDM